MRGPRAEIGNRVAVKVDNPVWVIQKGEPMSRICEMGGWGHKGRGVKQKTEESSRSHSQYIRREVAVSGYSEFEGLLLLQVLKEGDDKPLFTVKPLKKFTKGGPGTLKERGVLRSLVGELSKNLDFG